jgi:hypothetical protein
MQAVLEIRPILQSFHGNQLSQDFAEILLFNDVG